MATSVRKGFTLIELLVVISIVAFLASVVLAALNTTREKGRIGTALQFDANVYHALASDAVGVFNLEEGAGSVVNDSSGGTAGGVMGTATWTASTYYPASKQALSLDGAANYVRFLSCGISRRLDGAAGVTSTRWVYINALPSPGTYIVDMLTSGNGGSGHTIGINSNGTINLQARSVTADSLQSLDSTTALSPGKWYNIGASVNYVTKVMTIYIDGKFEIKSTGTFANNAFTQPSCTSIDTLGASVTPDRYFNGLIDNVRYYGASL